ncbi:ribonuclease H2 subunit C [Strigops habroptila]|uniref:Ribonuclease H2 subunit C n=1 Tax=Strigops habroptila TaxID=2489341 RepID=A0A672V5D5_STRHB|nr:ribonuclease H2 subunit C [Strigops habroptila]
MAAAEAVRLRPGPGAAAPLQAQLLPCRVQHDGPAPVAAFLRVQLGPGGELWASFRGRRMGGRDLPLPHGYRGVLLQEGDPPHGDEGRCVTVTGTFDAIRDWGADGVPPPGGVALALQWGDIAQAIHAPVPESDKEAEP